MTIIIIEDERLAAQRLQKLLLELDPTIELAATLPSIQHSIDWLSTNPKPDLIFTDIHLADGLCFNIFTQVQITCPIIFTTAYEKYAIQAFEVNSIAYLLKPIKRESLQQSLQKFEELKHSFSSNNTQLEELKKMLITPRQAYKTRFLCRLGQKIRSVSIDSIAYFFSQDKVTFIVTHENRKLPLNNSLEEVDNMLNPRNFFRINRKYIVHIEAIKEIHPYFKGRLRVDLQPPTDPITVSADRTPIFKAWLDQ